MATVSKRCPCGKFIPLADGHAFCVLCLGLDHAQAALCLPGECPHCATMKPSTLRFRATMCAGSSDDDPLPSAQPQRSVASGTGQPPSSPTRSSHRRGSPHASPVNFVGPAARGEHPAGLEIAFDSGEDLVSLHASDRESVLDPGEEEDDLDDRASLVHDVRASPRPAPLASELHELVEKAVKLLDISWPDPPPASQSRLDGCYFGTRQAQRFRPLPVFPDLIAEVQQPWSHPFTNRVTTQGSSPFVDIHDGDCLGLNSMPPAEESVAAYLAPSSTPWRGHPTLPSKPCRTTASLGHKAYACVGQACRTLNTAALLQVYQAQLLQQLGSEVTPEVVTELRKATDLALRLTKFTAQAQGKAMGYLVAQERHLWLNLASIPDREKVPLLDAPLTPGGLFGAAVGAMRERFETAQKDSAALRNLLPRRQSLQSRLGKQTQAQPPPTPQQHARVYQHPPPAHPRPKLHVSPARQATAPQNPPNPPPQAGRGWSTRRNRSRSRSSGPPRPQGEEHS